MYQISILIHFYVLKEIFDGLIAVVVSSLAVALDRKTCRTCTPLLGRQPGSQAATIPRRGC